jgi:ACS family tartrate transporter-like MFS transporter
MDDTATIGASAMRKALWRIVPLMLLAYLCGYMDRVNVGFAAVQMNVDLGFSATIYGLGGGLFFLGYALFEIPSNMMAVRYGSRRWLARIMISWGLISAATMLVRTPLEFYVMRLLLGVAEAGFWPGIIYYLALWFPMTHRGRAVSRFYVASPLAAVLMGAMSGWLLGLDGLLGLRGWHWLLLLQGLPSVAMGFVLLRWLPDTPAGVAWLSGEEKAWIEQRLAEEAALIGAPAAHDPFALLHNKGVLLLCATGFFTSGIMTTLGLSAPLLLLGTTGLDAVHVGYLVSVGGVIGAAAMLLAGDHADRRGDRFRDAFRLILVMAAALVAIAAAPSPAVVMVAYLAFAATCFTINMLLSSGWAEVLHVRELAVGAALINSIANLGGFALPFAWGAARDASGGFAVGLVALAVFAGVAAVLTLRVRAGVKRQASLPFGKV